MPKPATLSKLYTEDQKTMRKVTMRTTKERKENEGR